MKKLNLLPAVAAAATLVLISTSLEASGETARISSPNGKIHLNYDKASADRFRISYGSGENERTVGTVVPKGISTDSGRGRSLRLDSIGRTNTIHDEYEMQLGKKRLCSNDATECLMVYADSLDNRVDVRFRVYDDGVAFRYELDGLDNEKIAKESTVYAFEKGMKRWIQRYDKSYENFFPLDFGESEGHWSYPGLFQIADDTWALLTEAGIGKDNSASFLKSPAEGGDYELYLDENLKSYSGKWQSAWRTFIIGNLTDIVSSTLVTDLSEGKRYDCDWLQPGCASWVYWAYNRGSKDFQIVKSYIDLAASLRLPYVLIDWEWDIMENGGNIDDALAYAKEKGIKVMLWYNSSTAWVNNGAGGPLYRLNKAEDREREFSMLEKKGVAGVKIDFFDGDKQSAMEYCIDLLESAARHKLAVNFHGATLPRGWQRTYPNLITTEAVYGAEWYNNNHRFTRRAASHNAMLPFTRNVVGSMDYTPCTFSDSQHPHITTDAHELALTVLFESGVQHFADRPESYMSQPEEIRDFLTGLPAAWDETRLLSGYPGDHAVIARKKGDVWYVAGINGEDYMRNLPVDLSHLNLKEHEITLYSDANDGSKEWNIEKHTDTHHIEIPCRPRGGFVMKIQ